MHVPVPPFLRKTRARAPALAGAMLVLASLVAAAPASAQISWTPLTLREVSGTRPFVPVRLNGVPYLFMVHANAGFYAMTNHANADKAGVGPMQTTDPHYGIVKKGEVSPLGKGKATLKALEVGTTTATDVPLSVFEVPQDPVMDGMLGIEWLRRSRAVVDFDKLRVGIPAAPRDGAELRTWLLGHGYAVHAMTWDDAGKRYLVPVDVNGVPSTFVVSTVAHLVIDEALATRAGIALTAEPTDTYGGPSGTQGQVHDSTGTVRIAVDGQPAIAPKASVYDTYAYDARPRPAPEKQLGGYLGAEFLLPNKGVVDFGEGLLYLKK